MLVGLFAHYRSIVGNNLVSKGFVSIELSGRPTTGYTDQLCEKNNSLYWFLYIDPTSKLTFDFKGPIHINQIQMHWGESAYGYPWSQHPPSYAIEFSNDNNSYTTVFSESLSKRIDKHITDAYYYFDGTPKYRYARLRMTDYAENSWFEFFTSSVEIETCDHKNQYSMNSASIQFLCAIVSFENDII